MKPAHTMGTLIRVWRREWAGLSRAQPTPAVSAAASGAGRVTTDDVYAWEGDRPPHTWPELRGLLQLMQRHGPHQTELDEFHQALGAGQRRRRPGGASSPSCAGAPSGPTLWPTSPASRPAPGRDGRRTYAGRPQKEGAGQSRRRSTETLSTPSGEGRAAPIQHSWQAPRSTWTPCPTRCRRVAHCPGRRRPGRRRRRPRRNWPDGTRPPPARITPREPAERGAGTGAVGRDGGVMMKWSAGATRSVAGTHTARGASQQATALPGP